MVKKAQRKRPEPGKPGSIEYARSFKAGKHRGNTTTSDISDIHLKAIELKANRLTYKDIAKTLGVAHQTVCRWFYKGGILYKPYQDCVARKLAAVDKAITQSSTAILDKLKTVDTITPIIAIAKDPTHKDCLNSLKYINDIAHGIRQTEQQADISEQLKADIDKEQAVRELLKEVQGEKAQGGEGAKKDEE